MIPQPAKPGRNWIPALLALATLLIFIRIVDFGFVNFDDPTYIFHNLKIPAGLTLANISWSFTTFYFNNWHPLTWLTYFTTSQFFGVRPGPLHAINILLHAANVALLYLVLARLTAMPARSAMVAALFAIHPLHVESVAWISELKDVLSTSCLLLTMLTYLSFLRQKRLLIYLAMCVLFAMGLMAKSMIVTLPFVLLLIDYWPLGRLSKRSVLEKIPLLTIAAADCVMTMLAQSTAIASTAHIALWARLQNAVIAYGQYLSKTFLPIHLAVYYPHPAIIGINTTWSFAISLTTLIAITIAAVACRKSRPYVIVGWLWFIGTLVPVIGLVQVGEQAMADRYTYFPLVGLFIAVVWLFADLLPRISKPIAWTVLILCAISTEFQIGYWRNTQTLFSHALAVTQSNYIALDHLAVDQIEKNHPAASIPLAKESARINSASVFCHTILARAYDSLNRPTDALQAYHDAIQIEPADAELRINAGTALAALGRAHDAENQYNEAIRLNPRSVVAQCNLAILLMTQGRDPEAIDHWKSALRIDPNNPTAHQALAELQARRSQVPPRQEKE